jgi:hypothetical protein
MESKGTFADRVKQVFREYYDNRFKEIDEQLEKAILTAAAQGNEMCQIIVDGSEHELGPLIEVFSNNPKYSQFCLRFWFDNLNKIGIEVTIHLYDNATENSL